MQYVVTTVTPSGYVSSGIMSEKQKNSYKGEFVEALPVADEEAQQVLDGITASK